MTRHPRPQRSPRTPRRSASQGRTPRPEGPEGAPADGVILLASALSALLTALPAAMNQPVVGTWRITCGVAAFLSAVAAVTTGLQAQLNHADRIAEATECLGKLRALDLEYQLGNAPEADLIRQFSKIIAKYPQYT